jgi:hypothetical protein
MLPDTLLFEAAKEAFDDAILLRRVWRDEFLLQPVVATGSAEPPALKDEAIVPAQHGITDRSKSAPNRTPKLHLATDAFQIVQG